MTFRLACLLLSLLLLTPVGAQELYQNKEEGYRVTCPEGWRRTVEPGKVSLVAPEGAPLATIDFVVESGDGLEFEAWVRRYLEIAEADGAKALGEVEPATLDGRAARRVSLLYPIRGAEVRMEATIVPLGDRVLAVTRMSRKDDFAAHQKTFEQVVSSLRWEADSR